MESNSYFEGVNERILARVPLEAKRILEIGCAAGRLGERLKLQVPDREIWGIEAVPKIAATAKSRLDKVIGGDVEQMNPLPLPEGYFDCLICGDVLEHLRDPQKLLKRVRQHLDPEAVLIVNVPNVAHWSVTIQLLGGQFRYENQGLLDRTHLRFFTPQSLRQMLWEAGFRVVADEPLLIRTLYDRLGNPTPGDPPSAIGRTAAMLGIDPQLAETTAATYQQLYVAKPAPDPYSRPEKMAALVGPHVGNLGPATKRCSVIVLTYNSIGTIERCLDSLLPTIGIEDELILVDNASNDQTPALLTSFASHRSDTRVILNSSNLGFSAGCNIGILASQGKYIVLLNPDTEVQPGWIEGLTAHLADPKIGAAGPLSDNVCGDQFVGLYPDWGRLDVENSNLSESSDSNRWTAGYTTTRLLIGFCLALRRDLLDRFGCLEESCFLGADDLEISWRLRSLGYDLAVALNVFVAHETSRSFATLAPGEKSRLVFQSDAALISKLRAFYGDCHLPTSTELWGNAIFDEAFSRFKKAS